MKAAAIAEAVSERRRPRRAQGPNRPRESTRLGRGVPNIVFWPAMR